jgi:predicted ATPase
MLTALRLGNFKAFADTQNIPIRPITLIFGPNSAGKSSIIHGLVLAHEAERTKEDEKGLEPFSVALCGERYALARVGN